MNTFLQKVLWLCFILFLSFESPAQNITGTWQGNLNIQGTQLPIVFHIAKDSTNKLIASFDSPSQHAFNLPCNEVNIKDDSVILMMAMIKGKFAGLLSKDKKEITGMWYQGAGSLPLVVNKTSEIASVKEQKRPQTPKPPFPYHSEEVEYSNADNSINFGATLSYPETDSSKPNTKGLTYPAIILITGSGQQDRDETLFGHRPFAVIADYLTKKGFAVLRVDDRGIGKTTGVFDTSTTLDFAKDVEAGIDFLEKQPQVNKEKIGLLGHSEGGMIAPMVADKRKEIKFIVLLAGPGIPIMDLMQQQIEAVTVSEGKSPEEAKANSYLMRTVWEEVNKNEDSATTVRNIRAKIDVWEKTLDTATLAKIKSMNSAAINTQITQATTALGSKWYKYFISFNPQPYLQKLNCKVLALNGSKDVQVIATSNLAGIKSSLQKSGSPKYDIVEIPGLNHLFQTCIRCSPSEYNDLEESFSPKALEIMGNWLQKNVQQ
jgi:pimeloyl-ACP methyl ester carboxylesterase